MKKDDILLNNVISTNDKTKFLQCIESAKKKVKNLAKDGTRLLKAFKKKDDTSLEDNVKYARVSQNEIINKWQTLADRMNAFITKAEKCIQCAS